MTYSLNLCRGSCIFQPDFFLCRTILEIIDHIFSKFTQVNRLKHSFPIFLIQSGKLDNICNQIG